MKTKKLKYALLFLTFVLAVAIAACSADDKTTDTPDGSINANAGEAPAEPETAVNIYDDDLGEFDFDNYQFTVLLRVTPFHFDIQEETGDLIDDALYRRNRKVEERFNFKFKEVVTENITTTEVPDTGKKSILAGDNAYDIMLIRCPHAYEFAMEGLLHPITLLPHINIDKPYWDKDLTASWSVANRMFFAAGAYDLSLYSAIAALLFNKEIVAELNTENLYDLVKEGKWTFDKFEEIAKSAKKDLNGDGAFDENDRWGLIHERNVLANYFTIGGGVKSIDKNSEDIPYVAALDEKFINVWDKMIEVTLRSEICYPSPVPWEFDSTYLRDMFINGNSLFFGSVFGILPVLRAMDTDFGILPYPKYDENQNKYYSILVWNETTSIPVTAGEEALERTGVILEALAAESAKNVVPVYYDIALKTKFARDDESAEMLDLIFANRVFDWGTTIWDGFIRNGVFVNIYAKRPEALVSELEKMQPKIQKEIDKLIEAFEKSN